MVSQKGGRFQDKIYNLIIEQLGSPISGQLLDIGCGNGVLAVKLAQKHIEAEVLGMDYWGKNWEYSKEVCENNARISELDNRIHFQKGDAAALGLANETFDGVVSNLTFHEVASVSDKREVVREALRVVKTGGRFTFVDYFYNDKHYGPTAEFRNYLQSLNLSHFEIRPLREMIELPILMRHPKILGKAGILYGWK
jgi:ubiquinone/menaquinone biosynthesis C-methylase UbiE